jgi:hypothetical protein
MPKIAGTLRKFSIEGISYELHGDTNVTEIFVKYENSRLPTTGQNMRKMVKRITAREGFVLATDANERAQIKSFAESLDDLQISYTNASGDEYKALATIEVENNETEENRTTLQAHPVTDWTEIIA